ncbi:MbtH family protein [Streptomyces sp. NPDC059534]|uniref:MbtH family protein n=1 Tax=Streptomyces sp. NPDC059534 TaxID=3346859 RepID=UPI0036977E3D
MSNPFEDEGGRFLVLVNAEEQHSLWPAEIPVPDGWDVAHGPQDRAGCLRYVEDSWTDMRPASIRK